MTPYKTGDRIRLIHMDNDLNPIPVGTTGTVASVTDRSGQLHADG